MTTYYGLYGQKVQYLASDPTDVQIGQVWYNSTSAVLKVRQAVATNTFASGGNMNTTRRDLSGTGTQTAALACGGQIPGNTPTNSTEKYDGTSWTATGNLNTGRNALSVKGTQTAGLAFGGEAFPPSPATLYSATESFNGTSWTTVPGSLNTARSGLASAGTQTATLGFGGGNPSLSPVVSAATELYNGTSWTSNPTGLATARYYLSGCGTQTAALATSGDTPPTSAATEEWNVGASTKKITTS